MDRSGAPGSAVGRPRVTSSSQSPQLMGQSHDSLEEWLELDSTAAPEKLMDLSPNEFIELWKEGILGSMSQPHN